MLEPRDPLLKVFTNCVVCSDVTDLTEFNGPPTGARRPGSREGEARQSNKGRYTVGEELGAETPGSARPLSR